MKYPGTLEIIFLYQYCQKLIQVTEFWISKRSSSNTEDSKVSERQTWEWNAVCLHVKGLVCSLLKLSLSLYANEISTGSICPNLKMQILNDACFLVYKM